MQEPAVLVNGAGGGFVPRLSSFSLGDGPIYTIILSLIVVKVVIITELGQRQNSV